MAEEKRLTTASGTPVADNQNSLTAGPHRPGTTRDLHLMEKMAHFNRERIPERVVHAKGAGAYGYFEVTHDLTAFCKASLFSAVGKRTEVVTRGRQPPGGGPPLLEGGGREGVRRRRARPARLRGPLLHRGGEL